MTPYGREILRKICKAHCFEELPKHMKDRYVACHVCANRRGRGRYYVASDLLAPEVKNPRAGRQMLSRVASNLWCDVCLVAHYGQSVVPNFDMNKVEMDYTDPVV
jgi:hypothetical protein